MDIFSNLPELDLSVLTNKKEDKSQTRNTRAGGDIAFPLDNDIEPEPEKTDKTEKTEPTNNNRLSVNEEKPEKQEEKQEEKHEKQESAIRLIAEFLKEKGLLDYSEEEFKDEDDFIPEKFKSQYNTDIQSYKDNLPEPIKFLIENYEEGVPLGSLLEREQAEAEYSALTDEKLEDTKLQESVITDYLKATGWTNDEITDRVKELEDAGIMEKWAKIARDKLVNIQKTEKQEIINENRKQKQEYEKQKNQQIALLNDTVKNTKEFIEGIPTNELEKKAVIDSILKVNKNNQNKIQEFLSDSKNYIKLAYIVGVLKGDFTKLKTAAKTQATRELREVLDSPNRKTEFSSAGLDALKNYLKKPIN